MKLSSYKMPFGKWKGTELEEIYEDDPSYLEWVDENLENDDVRERVSIFVCDNCERRSAVLLRCTIDGPRRIMTADVCPRCIGALEAVFSVLACFRPYFERKVERGTEHGQVGAA